MNLNLGMDFGQLANVARPQMMPNAPIGAGAMAGGHYAEQEQRYNQFLQQAALQAQEEARLKGMAAEEEFSPEAVQLRSKKRQNDLLHEQDVRPMEREERLLKIQKIIRDEENRPVVEAANIYAADGDLEGALNHIKVSGKDKFQNHTFFQNPDTDAKVLKGIFRAAQNTPGFAGKKAIEEVKGSFKVNVANIQQAGANGRAELRAQIDRAALELRRQIHQTKNDAVGKKKVKHTLETLIADNIAELVKAGMDYDDAVAAQKPLTDLKKEFAEAGKPKPFDLRDLRDNLRPDRKDPPKEALPKFKSAEEVKAAFKKGRLTEEQALQILQKDFGMK